MLAGVHLDPSACYVAVQSRDARFDGRFCTAVLSTRIYCRPSCPARTPLQRNVRFYVDPAAAEVAGFRACKRCRPDRAPGDRDVDVRGDLVARALRLISEGVVERSGVPGLAAHLAVSERHLRRVLRSELGAGPLDVARNRRTRLATALLEGSDLPVGEVAFAAGFGSIRQFNDTVLRATGRSPGEIRGRSAERGAGLAVRLPVREPFDHLGLLQWLDQRTVPGLDRVSGNTWTREDPMGTVSATLACDHVRVQVRTDDPRSFAPLVQRVRRALDLDATPDAVSEVLGQDPALADLVRRHPGQRVPASWTPWEGLVRTVIGQQVSLRAAATLLTRTVEAHGGFPGPEAVARTPPSGMPERRVRTLCELAERVLAGRLVLDGSWTPEEVAVELATVAGIGPWTLAYVRLRALRDPDALPATDLVLRRRAAARGLDLTDGRAPWSPWRSYAAHLLWRDTAR
jgi:AraC family transcriptional regulator of adaptative response / DNA-3-methyladenine glycosylase II